MDTSKTSSIKSLLMKAWRERWSDVRWGINIKNVLPRGVSGDVYDLADCILQQALVGPGPNHLFLSYLIHCLSSQTISYGAAFSSIARFDQYHKSQCLIALIDIVEKMQQRVVCHGNEEECIALCKSMVNVTLWLYNCMLFGMAGNVSDPVYAQIIDKSVSSLSYFSENTFLKSLLYIGKYEEKDAYAMLLTKHSEVQQKLSGNMEKAEKALKLVGVVDQMNSIPSEPSFRKPGPVIGLVTNIAVEAILMPANSVQNVADSLLLTKKLLNLPDAIFYCEVLRSCLMGISDSAKSGDLKWAAFTFLKLPLVLAKIANRDPAFIKGVELVLQYTPLLETADAKCNCDCISFMITEFKKVDLVTDAQMEHIRSKRKATEVQLDQPPSSASLILKAEPTVTTILTTLDSDYSRNQDSLLAVLCQMITGKSFELILSAAASIGKLDSFVQKLIKFNEYNNPIVVERSETRALLFDITFLMLCHIAQHYGIDAVLCDETKNSFFAQWVPDCLVDPNRYACPDKMLTTSNPEKVDLLLRQMLDENLDLKTTHQKWSDLVQDLPAAIKEIIIGWEHGIVTTNTVKRILDQIKGKMCSLPVIVSTWLCCYINILHHEECLKPINIMTQFVQPNQNVGDQPGAPEYYKERSALMSSIIRKMMYNFHPPNQKAKVNALTDKTPLWTTVEEIFENVHSGAWIDVKTINNLNGLIDVAGPVWFCDALIRQALKYSHQDDLNRAVELAYGIFQIDVQHCALALLTNVLPNYLLWESKQDFLTEPRGSALAKLVVLTTMTALKLRERKDSKENIRRKHPFWDMELQESLINHSKSKNKNRRINSDLDNLEDTPYGLQYHNIEDKLEPLDRAIAELFRLLYCIATEPVISQRSFFPLELFRQFVLCGEGKGEAGEPAAKILHFLPLGFISQLVRAMPNNMTHETVLALSSFTTSRARKVVARATCQLQITQAMH